MQVVPPALPTTAAKSTLGVSFRLPRQRGQWFDIAAGARAMATVHPSYVLRVDAADRSRVYAGFLADLRAIKEAI